MMQRPTVMGGIDAFSHEIATRLMKLQSHRHTDEANIEVVHLGDENSDTALKKCLADQRERLRTSHDNPMPRVVMLAAAFHTAGLDGLQQLAAISDTLAVALPGDQEITLVVLLPPPVASDAEKITAYRFFTQLETLAYATRFLKTILVNPVSHAMYADGALGADDDDVLFKLLQRQLFDADIDNVIQSSGGGAIGNKTRTAGRNGCYATSGAFTLIYNPDECVAYLQARLQKMLFEEELMNVASLEADSAMLEQIQEQSDALVRKQVAAQRALLNDHPAQTPDMGEVVLDAEALDAGIETVRKQINTMAQQVPGPPRSAADKPDAVSQAFHQFLAEGPGHLAGGDLYLQSLGGRQLVDTGHGEPPPPSGVDLFHQETYLLPLLTALETFYAPLISKHFRHADMAPPHDDGATWLANAITACKVAEAQPDAEDPMVATLCHSLHTLGSHCIQDSIALSDAVDVSEELLDLLQQEGRQYIEKAASIEQTVTDADQAFAQFKKDIGFWGRWFSKRSLVKAERAKNDKLHADSQKEMDTLQRQFADCQRFYFDLLAQVVFPAIVRAPGNQAFIEKVQALSDQFSAFVSHIQDKIDLRWQQASAITHVATAMLETVLNKPIIEQQFEQIIDRTVCTVEHLLAWQPLSDDDKKALYPRCRDLAEHFDAGAKSLDQRLQDYAAVQAAPAGRLTIMDIIETSGKKDGREFLKRRLERLERFLDLSPGLMPLVHQDAKALKTIIVRSARSVLGRLSADHSDLFNVDTRWLHGDDAHTIDFTGLYFGLPAFVIHTLSECRALCQASEEAVDDDLWPLDLETMQS